MKLHYRDLKEEHNVYLIQITIAYTERVENYIFFSSNYSPL